MSYLAPEPSALPPSTFSPADSTPPAPADSKPPAPADSKPPAPAPFPPFPLVDADVPEPENRTASRRLGLGIGIAGGIVLVCVCVFFIWYTRRTRRPGMGGGDGGGAPYGPKGNCFANLFHHQQLSVPPPSPPPTDNLAVVLQKSTPPGISSSSSSSIDGYSNPHPPPSAGSSLNSQKPLSPLSSDSSLAFVKTIFTYEELASATSNFARTNLLGEGGFGYVHKGVLPNGKEVAIKQLKAGSGQGEREFQAEIGIISHVHHKHLVSVVGYCYSRARRLLVYEYVPNKTLEFHLHGEGQPTLNWATRMKIALGSAKGLVYLHDDCQLKIVHRDIKAANILLDDNFEAKVADFGLARLCAAADTHVSTRVLGTFGYLAPEYALSGKLTEKSDVFSFGVVLLELITGRRPIDKKQRYLDDNIVDWARPLLSQALDDLNFDTVVDPRLQKNFDPVEMARMVVCASVCVRHLARLRPKMSQIVLALEGKVSLDDLNKGKKPGDSTIYCSYGSSDYDKSQYKEDLKKFREMALRTLENNSSECSGPTSEFGVQPSTSSSEGLGNTREIRTKYEAQLGNEKGGEAEDEEKRG